MSHHPLSIKFLGVAAVAAVAAAGFGIAQDEAATPAHGRDLQPRPAEMARLAARTLLLAVTQAGDRIVAVGDRGIILVSGDGTTWAQRPSPVHATLTTVSFADAQHGWAGGHDASILRTTDGGQTWTLQHFAPELNKPVLSILALDAQRAYAAGAYGLFLATTDGGQNWTPVDAPEILEEEVHLNSLIRLPSGALFIAGETGFIAHSADGTSWRRLTLPYEGSLFGALPRGEHGALVFGLRGNVLATDDVRSGQWTEIRTGTVQSLFGGARLPGGEAVLVGADDALLIVKPDGTVQNLGRTGSITSATLSGVLVWSEGRVVLVGEQGVRVETLPR